MCVVVVPSIISLALQWLFPAYTSLPGLSGEMSESLWLVSQFRGGRRVLYTLASVPSTLLSLLCYFWRAFRFSVLPLCLC